MDARLKNQEIYSSHLKIGKIKSILKINYTIGKKQLSFVIWAPYVSEKVDLILVIAKSFDFVA